MSLCFCYYIIRRFSAAFFLGLLLLATAAPHHFATEKKSDGALECLELIGKFPTSKANEPNFTPVPTKEPNLAINFQKGETLPDSSANSSDVLANFAGRLYSEAIKNKAGKNILLSPYIVYTVLGMAYEGAAGQTATEMRQVLSSSAEPKGLATNEQLKAVGIETANSLWVQREFKIQPEYQKAIEGKYSGTARLLDFSGAPETSRETINSYIAEATNNHIQNLLPEGAVNPMTRLVLANAAYFKGAWEFAFNPKDTSPQRFTTADGKQIKVPMMRLNKTKLGYGETETHQVLELPFQKGLVMIAVLPKKNEEALLQFSDETWRGWRDSIGGRRVYVNLPKLKFSTELPLKEQAKQMGMPSAFSGDADFSKITGKPDLSIGDIFHKAVLEVNEEGAEAAAASAITMGLKSVSAEPPPAWFTADRPFLLFIADRDGLILFVARVSDPSQN